MHTPNGVTRGVRLRGKLRYAVFATVLFFTSLSAIAQQPAPMVDTDGDMGIGTLRPDPSAIVDMGNFLKGLLIPRLTEAQRNAIPWPAKGLFIYNLTSNRLEWNFGDNTSPLWVGVLHTDGNENLELNGALEPNGDPGNPGDVLTSQGPNLPPVWLPPTSSNGWLLGGNSSTTPGTAAGENYLGTTDNKDLVLATSGIERARIMSSSNGGGLSIQGPFLPGGTAGTTGQVLVTTGSATPPTWSSNLSLNNLTASGTTNISGSASTIGTTNNTVGSGPETQITIGYNDPDGAGADGPSTTVINGNVTFANPVNFPLPQNNLWVGNAANLQTPLPPTPNRILITDNAAGGTPQWGNSLPSGVMVPSGSVTLAQNNIFVGNASNIATATSPGASGTVLNIVGSTPSWSSSNSFTTTAPAGGGAVTNINTGDVNSGNNSEATTNIGYNDPDGAVATNSASQTNVFGNINLNNTTVASTVNIGSGGGSGGTTPNTINIGNGPTGSSSSSTTNLYGTVNFGSLPNLPLTQHNMYVGSSTNQVSELTTLSDRVLTSPGGVPTWSNTLPSGVTVPNSSLALSHNAMFVGNASNDPAELTSSGLSGALLTQDASGAPIWTTAGTVTTTSGSAPATNINVSDLNNGSGTESAITIGYSDPDGSNPANGSSTTTIRGDVNINTADPGRTSPQTTTIGYNDPDGAGGNAASLTVINGDVNIPALNGQFWRLTGNTGTNPAIQFIGTGDGQPLVVRTNNNERLRVASTGEVSIGSTTADAKLRVGDGNTVVFNGVYTAAPQSQVVSESVANFPSPITNASTLQLTNLYFSPTTNHGIVSSNINNVEWNIGAGATVADGFQHVNLLTDAAGAGTTTTLVQSSNHIQVLGTSAGSYQNIIGERVNLSIAGGTVQNIMGVEVTANGPGIAQRATGISVSAQGSTAVGLQIGGVIGTTSSWAIKSDEDAPSRYGGAVLIDPTVTVGNNTPTHPLHVIAAADPARLEGLQYTAALDTVIVTDHTGVLRKRAASTLASAPALAQDNIFVGNTSNIATATAPGASGTVLNIIGSTPSWSSTNNFTTTAPAGGGAVTNINTGDVNSGNNNEATTNIGYNDPDGAGVNQPSQTNIFGNTNLSGNTTQIGTTNNVVGGGPETQITIGYNDPDGAGADGPSVTTINGIVNFAHAPVIPLPQNNLWVGNASNVQAALAPSVNSILVTDNVAGGTPQWSTVLPPGIGVTPSSLSLTQHNMYVGNATNQVSELTTLSDRVLTSPGGVPTWSNTLPSGVVVPSGSVTLAQNNIFVGNASNIATATSPGASGTVLNIVGSTPSWSSTNSFTTTAPAGGGAVTNINTGDVNSGNNNEATTNIGYNDPDGAVATNSASQTNVFGNINLNNTTVASTVNIGSGGGSGGTTPNTINIGNGPSGSSSSSTTNLYGTVNFGSLPNLPLTQHNMYVGSATNQVSELTTLSDRVLTSPGGVPTWSSTLPSGVTVPSGSVTLAQNNIFVGNASNIATATAPGASGTVLNIVGSTPSWSSTNSFTTTAPAGGGAVTNINTGDVNSGNNSEATTNIGYNDPDGAVATNSASQTNVFGNTNLGSNNGSGGGATTTSIVGNASINATQPNSSVVQTTTIGYSDPDGGGSNAASQTTVLGNINLNTTTVASTMNIGSAGGSGGTTPNAINIGNGPTGSASSSTTTIYGNVNIPALDGQFWRLNGNTGTTSGTNFIGTTDNQALQLHVFNGNGTANEGTGRALRIEPRTGIGSSPNIVAGYSANAVTSGFGAVIGGGGSNGRANQVAGNFGVVGGGESNTATGTYSVIGGGTNNQTSGTMSAIPGGQYLKLGANSFGFNGATVATLTDLSSTGANVSQTAYLGNVNLWLGNVDGTARHLRFYEPNASLTYTGTQYSSFAAQGQTNNVNYILPTDTGLVVGRSLVVANVALPNVTLKWDSPAVSGPTQWWDTVTGSSRSLRTTVPTANNTIGNNTQYSIVAGGNNSILAQRDWSTIAGGQSQLIGGTATHSFIGSGERDTILGRYSAIVSGQFNKIESGILNCFIGGGQNNTASTNYGVIGGGQFNVINGSSHCFIGGGEGDTILASAVHSVIVGGEFNKIDNNSDHSAIVGGEGNVVGSNSTFNVIGGGLNNLIDNQAGHAGILSGEGNTISAGDHSSILGGLDHVLGGARSVIVGGRGLTLNGDRSFGFHANNNTGTRGLTLATANTAAFGNVDLALINNDNTTRQLRFYETYNAAGGLPAGTNYTSFESQAMGADIEYILPAAGGAVGQQLTIAAVAGTRYTLNWAAAASDKNKKTDFLEIDGEDVLAKFNTFSLGSWRYKPEIDPNGKRHYGIMAQDFFRAFGNDGKGVIGTDTTIDNLDLHGINFLAIQGLERRTSRTDQKVKQQEQEFDAIHQRLDVLQQENQYLRDTNQRLLRRLEAIEQQMEGLVQSVQPIR